MLDLIARFLIEVTLGYGESKIPIQRRLKFYRYFFGAVVVSIIALFSWLLFIKY